MAPPRAVRRTYFRGRVLPDSHESLAAAEEVTASFCEIVAERTGGSGGVRHRYEWVTVRYTFRHNDFQWVKDHLGATLGNHNRGVFFPYIVYRLKARYNGKKPLIVLALYFMARRQKTWPGPHHAVYEIES